MTVVKFPGGKVSAPTLHIQHIEQIETVIAEVLGSLKQLSDADFKAETNAMFKTLASRDSRHDATSGMIAEIYGLALSTRLPDKIRANIQRDDWGAPDDFPF